MVSRIDFGNESFDDLPELNEIQEIITILNIELYNQLDEYFGDESVPEIRMEFDGFQITVTFLNRLIWESELDDELRGDFDKPSLETYLRESLSIICEGLGTVNLRERKDL
jgi:hypothetical protein